MPGTQRGSSVADGGERGPDGGERGPDGGERGPDGGGRVANGGGRGAGDGSASLRRGLAVLHSFAAEPAAGSVSAVAESLRLNRTTVHRYVTTLRALGYLDVRRDGPRYRLTPRAAELGRAALGAHAIAATAQPQLDALRRATGCTVRLAVPLQLDALIVARARSSAEGQGLTGVEARVGALLPGWCTALGKALVAGLDLGGLDPQLRRVALNRRASLERTRHLGCAIEDEEHLPSVSAIAIRLRLPSGATPVAIDVVGRAPQVTIATLLADALPRLLETARSLSEALGSMSNR